MQGKPIAWVTGAAGLIGSHLMETANLLAPEYQVIGITRQDVDLTDFTSVRALFLRQNPALIIHCAAMSRSPDCQANPTLARKINVDATACLAELAVDARFVFFSTDLVFDGQKGDYVETDSVNPLSVYAETKVAAENLVLKNPWHVVIRTSLNGGVNNHSRNAFNQELRRIWRNGEATRLFTDEFRCPLSASVTARAIWELVKHDASGLYHMAGGQRLSRFEIGQILAARHPGLAPKIEASSLVKYTGAPRPPDCSLDLDKIHKVLPFKIPGLVQWLKENPDTDF